MPVLVMENELCDGEPLQLQPFIHQVGGTSGMLVFNETTLCKPLIDRERYFYENVPEELKEFMPEFRVQELGKNTCLAKGQRAMHSTYIFSKNEGLGVVNGTIEVELQEDSTGYVVVRPPEVRGSDFETYRSSPTPGSTPVRLTGISSEKAASKYSESADKSTPLLNTGHFASSEHSDSIFHSDDHKSESPQQKILNPWSLKCHKRQLSRMRKLQETNGNNDTYKFILLENVVAQFRCPCILDLKMGTRQYGDDSSEEKKLRKMRRVETSTSSSIGVRICGMQVYQMNTDNFICHNKYYGRTLSVKGFKKALYQFLQNGERLRTDVVHRIVPKLHHLYHLIEKQDTFRFYSSSLLIMYEGLDQAKKTCDTFPTSSVTDSCVDCQAGKHTTDKCTHQASYHSPVDVRIIDFAHTTHKGFLADETHHSGPDEGYLFGLENLKKMFSEILS